MAFELLAAGLAELRALVDFEAVFRAVDLAFEAVDLADEALLALVLALVDLLAVGFDADALLALALVAFALLAVDFAALVLALVDLLAVDFEAVARLVLALLALAFEALADFALLLALVDFVAELLAVDLVAIPLAPVITDWNIDFNGCGCFALMSQKRKLPKTQFRPVAWSPWSENESRGRGAYTVSCLFSAWCNAFGMNRQPKFGVKRFSRHELQIHSRLIGRMT